MPAPRRWFWFYRAPLASFELQARQNVTNNQQSELIHAAFDRFQIELPSLGICQHRHALRQVPAAGRRRHDRPKKFSDAGQVHRWTGVCPTVALHVLWDLPQRRWRRAMRSSSWPAAHGLRAGAINPNVFQDQIYKYGSLGNPDPAIRQAALDHLLDSVEIGKRLGSRDVSLWFADGSNYPGTQNIRQRKQWFEEGLRRPTRASIGDQRMLVEYKPFEPAFYHTDIADWGMALEFCALRRTAGQGAGGHRPPLPGAEHRADRGVAAGSGHAGRLPLQRPPLCRRRSDHGLHRSLPGVPHFPRDPVLRMGDRASAPISPT